ncbi:TrbC/VirB2 family protein [uncultured Ruegeria sp.]|uniref:TrbC/VirB2 family protein n=1 Tax=uncultured Ruegeria sp. TaxID=259304 RepID=UPI002632858F|nr:TrbC/VirB2 family protein [uncultured Ruegeria sp.]
MLNVIDRTILLAVLLLLVFISQADPAFAEVNDSIFEDAQPFQKFIAWVTGGFATFLAIILVLVAGFMLASGSDFSGFARRIPTMLLGLGFILLATKFITFLFGSSGVVLLPHEIAAMQTPAVTRPAIEAREEIAPEQSPTPEEIAHVR